GPVPWAVAVTDGGDAEDLDETVVISHRIARLRSGGVEGTDDGNEGWLTTALAADLIASATASGGGTGIGGGTAGATSSPPTARQHVLEPYGFGFANGLEALSLHGGKAFVAHLLNSPEYPRDFETTVSAALSGVTLAPGESPEEGLALRLHLNDEAFSTPVNHPTGVAVSAD